MRSITPGRWRTARSPERSSGASSGRAVDHQVDGRVAGVRTVDHRPGRAIDGDPDGVAILVEASGTGPLDTLPAPGRDESDLTRGSADVKVEVRRLTAVD